MKFSPSYELTSSQFINKPIEEVFAFFSKPENLERITPENLNFSIITPTPIPMKKGQVIDYVIKLRGFKMRWSSIITDYKPPSYFIDEQIRGPYSVWIHKHYFTEKDGGTLIEDCITYKIPLGILGRIAHYLFVRNDLEKIFEFRSKTISKILVDDK